MKTFITFVVIFALFYSLVYFFGYRKAEEEEKKNLKKAEQLFEKHSSVINKMDLKEVHKFGLLNSRHQKMTSNSEITTHNYKPLFERLDKMKFKHTYGKYYFDEYSKELLRKKEKFITLTFGERDLRQSKYKSEKNYKGYKTSKNRKAHKLQKKYGWSKSDCGRVVGQRYWIGMSDKMAIESLGKPHDINRTVTARSVSEQWVYRWGDTIYLYFDDGIMTSYQN